MAGDRGKCSQPDLPRAEIIDHKRKEGKILVGGFFLRTKSQRGKGRTLTRKDSPGPPTEGDHEKCKSRKDLPGVAYQRWSVHLVNEKKYNKVNAERKHRKRSPQDRRTTRELRKSAPQR